MISHLIITSLLIWGVYAVFSSRHLLGKLGAWIEDKTSTAFCRPLFLCPTCMSSVWGGVAGIIIYDFSLTVIVFVLCLAGLNYIINSLLPEYE